MARAATAPSLLRRLVHPAAGLLAVAISLTACGGEQAGDDLPAGEVVLYTSMPTPIVERLELIFEGVYPDLGGQMWVAPGAERGGGMTLTVVRDATGPLLDRIRAEIAGPGLGADVIWLADPAAMEELKAAEALARYDPPADAPIPAQYVDPDGYYVAGRVINMVIAWNTVLVPDGLDDWPDLLEGGHRRRAFPSPRSGAALAAVKALHDAYGADYFQELAASGVFQVDSNSVARDAIVAGDYPAAVVLDYMIRQARASGMTVDMSFPASGTVVVPSPVAVSASAANHGAAVAFIDFVLSEPGQRVLVEIGSFYAVRTDVAPPFGAPPLASIRQLPVDWHELLAEREQLAAMWQESFR